MPSSAPFKVGDRVKVKDNPDDYIDKRNKNRTGTILRLVNAGMVVVHLDVHPKIAEIKFMRESLEHYEDPLTAV